jgi:hypothetical protein
VRNRERSTPAHHVKYVPSGSLLAMMWLLCVIAVVRNIRTLDETGQRIHPQVASIAFVATVILNYVFFGLETARIYALKATDPLSKKRDGAIRTTCPYCRPLASYPWTQFSGVHLDV